MIGIKYKGSSITGWLKASLRGFGCEMMMRIRCPHRWLDFRALAKEHNITIGLAIIPGLLHPEVLDFLADSTQLFFPMCHGWKHVNHGTTKMPSEFGNNRSFSSLVGDAVFAYNKFCEFFDTKAIFVPPYNSITKTLTAALPGIGFAGLSGGPSHLEARIARLLGKVWVPTMRIPVAGYGSANRRADRYYRLATPDCEGQTSNC